MKIVLYLYPVVLTSVAIVAFFVLFLVGFHLWRTGAKVRGSYSNKVEMRRAIAILTSAVFLFFAADITMYQLGADISVERLRFSFSSFFFAVAGAIYFGFVVPKIFRFDYDRLPFNESSLRNLPKAMLSGILFFGFAFLTAKMSHALSRFVFDTYAPCVLNF